MNFLGVLVAGLFAGLTDFLVAYFSKELATRLAFGALFVSGFAVMVVSVQTLLAGLSMAMPQMVVDAFSLFPSNLGICISAIITTDSICTGYRLYLLGAGK